MRIAELQLIAFGPFTNARIDLSRGSEGLHMIYGPNEAGKSTSLRAISDLFFGFPSRTSDNFKHPYQRLRIGAKLVHSDGRVLEIVRRKATKNSLFGADDTTPLEEDDLHRLMGDVDRDLFQNMFGIDHERLRHGGEEIVQGEGRIGELLFAAGAGLTELKAVQGTLRMEIENLLKSSGRSGAVVASIKEFQERRNALKQSQVSVETWNRHAENLRAASARKSELDELIGKERSELNRLNRIRDAVSSIGKWKKAKSDLRQFAQTPLLPEDFEKNSNELLIKLRTAEQQQTDAEQNIRKIDKELMGIDVPEELLAESVAMESIRDRLGGYRKAMSDRPALETQKALADREAKEILKEIGRPADLSSVEELRLPADKTVRIQNLGSQQEVLIERVQTTRRLCEKIRNEIDSLESRLAEIRVPESVEAHRQVVRDALREGDLETQLEALRQEIRDEEEGLNVALCQLGLWSGSLEEVELLAVPTLEIIEQYAAELQDKQGQVGSLEDRLKEKTSETEQLTAELNQLEQGRKVPTLEELEFARQLRDRGWQLVLDSFNKEEKGKEEKDKEVEDYINQFKPLSNLTDAFRQSLEAADLISDQLRNDAEKVATKMRLQSDIAQKQDESSSLSERITVAKADLSATETAWEEIWNPLAIAVRSPIEMRDWLRKQQELAQSVRKLRAHKADLEQLGNRISTRIVDIRGGLKVLEPGCVVEEKSLRELLRDASNKLDEVQKAENLFEQLSRELESSRSELADAETSFAEFQQELADWQGRWSAEMKSLGLDKDSLPAQANNVLANISRLFQKYQEADQFRVRIEAIDREAREFDKEVGELIGRTLPELADQPVDDAVGLVSIRLKEARSASDQRETLLKQRQELEKNLSAAKQKISQFRAALDEILRQASCDNYELLPEAANRSRKRRELERTIAELEDWISSQSGGADFQAFVAEAEATDVDRIEPAMEELEESIERWGKERDEIIGQIQAENIELKKIDGGAEASENAAVCESISARLEEQVRDLAKLRVCNVLLHTAIEQHRKKNQGPVLGRASEIFRLNTLGGFEELRADFNDRGEPVLTGVRGSNGEVVPVSGMSDGTCDQLYLALRIASLENWLGRHEPIPFIIDDVLLNFDDDRAIASLKVLASLSHQTQVVFFTHHQHVVEMAQANLSKEDLFVTSIVED